MPSCPFAGLPLVSPDVCPPPTVSQSGRSLLPCPSQQPQGPPALLPTPQQHPMGNHMIAQVCASSVRIYVMTYLYIIRDAFVSRETLMLMVSRKLVLSWLSKIENWRVFMWRWRYFSLSLITQSKGNSLHNFGLIFHLGHILLIDCKMQIRTFCLRVGQKSLLNEEVRKKVDFQLNWIIATIRNVCLPLTEMHRNTEIQRTNPLTRNKTSCTCWRHALIIQLFTKCLFTFPKILIKHKHHLFPDEIDLWNYLLFVMSCLLSKCVLVNSEFSIFKTAVWTKNGLGGGLLLLK